VVLLPPSTEPVLALCFFFECFLLLFEPEFAVSISPVPDPAVDPELPLPMLPELPLPPMLPLLPLPPVLPLPVLPLPPLPVLPLPVLPDCAIAGTDSANVEKAITSPLESFRMVFSR
jgi:hypothetical protein